MADAFGSASFPFEIERKLDGGRTPEIRVDQSGSCMARYNGLLVPANRTEHILSRYRPIAPKPLVVKPGESAGSAASEPQSSSTLSFERTSAKATSVSSEGSKGKRSRKRLGSDYLVSPRRPAKRGSARSVVRPEKPRTVSCTSTAVVGGIEKAVEQFSPGKSGWQQQQRQRPPVPTVGGFVHLQEGPPPTYVTEMAPGQSPAVFAVPGSGRVDRRKYGYGFGAIGVGKPAQHMGLENRVGSDTSAAVACMSDPCPPNCACTDRRVTSSPMKGFQKMRGYSEGFVQGPKCGLSGEASRGYYEGFQHAQKSGLNGQVGYHLAGPSLLDRSSDSYLRGGLPGQLPAYPSVSNSIAESEVISDADSRKTNLVTLSLLPDKPQEDNMSIASRPTCKNPPFLPLEMGIAMRSFESEMNQEEGGEELHKLTLFRKDLRSEVNEGLRRNSSLSATEGEHSWGRSSSSEKQSHPVEGQSILGTVDKSSGSAASCRGGDDMSEAPRAALAVIDADMEQAYSGSGDPVMLTEEANAHNILWANYAFKRASAEKSSGKGKDNGGFYLDPLGVPTQLSAFSYQTPQGPIIKALLWGFLKKFMIPETNGASLLAEGREGEARIQIPETKLSKNMDEELSRSLQPNHPKPITPQPLRPVGSTLTVECVESLNHYASPITDNLESVKEQLESAPMPCVITDYRNRVRWVNAAYKQMVGQPECSWLASTVGKKSSRETAQRSRLTGEVALTCNEPLSQLSAIFSCRLHVQWTNQGEEMSRPVTCEVTRIDNERLGNMYVWKLDTLPSSRLQQGGAQ